MQQSLGKAFYLLLSSILGILLFMLLERSAFTIYVLLSTYSAQSLAGNLNPALVQAVEAYSLLIALFLGAWYGIWLGLNWHHELYGEGAKPKLFHRFIPHSMRAKVPVKADTGEAQAVAVTIKPTMRKTVAKTAKPKTVKRAPALKTKEVVAWSFDDLVKAQPAVKPLVKKTRSTRVKKATNVAASETVISE